MAQPLFKVLNPQHAKKASKPPNMIAIVKVLTSPFNPTTKMVGIKEYKIL